MSEPGKIRRITEEEMIRRVRQRLEDNRKFDTSAFTMLIGAGFSVPVIPTASGVLNDLPWWLFCRKPGNEGRYKYEEKPPTDNDSFNAFKIELWKNINSAPDGKITLKNGLPDTEDADNVTNAYKAIMAGAGGYGLNDPQRRREYLRSLIEKAKHKNEENNGAHLFLASILAAQDNLENKGSFCRTILTTNFDPLLQNALQMASKLYFMSDRPAHIEPPDEDAGVEAIHLLYTHGSVHRYELLNTDDEIGQGQVKNSPKLISHFERHGVIVMGYGGWPDATMAALEQCSRYDGNLYWCDRHESPGALSPRVQKLLRTTAGNAFYVKIDGATQAMMALHMALDLGRAPQFITDPFNNLMAQLDSIVEVDLSSTSTDAPDYSGFPNAVKDTKKHLALAKKVYDNLSLLKAKTPKDKSAVRKAKIDRMLTDALRDALAGKLSDAIKVWTEIINMSDTLAEDKATALYNRGVTYGMQGNTAEAIADYTTVIEIPDAPAEQKAQALLNRGVTYGTQGEAEKAIADFTTVIEVPGAPTEQRAKSLLNRGVTYRKQGEAEKVIADYTTVIEMPDVSAERKAQALYNRGLTYRKQGEAEKAIADYTTVIEMPDVSAERKAQALSNRGVTYGKQGEAEKAIADFTTVIEMPDAPAEPKARALINRGVVYGKQGDVEKAIADFTTVIEMPDAPTEQKADALINRGVAYGTQGNVEKEIADYTAVIEMPDAPAEQESSALNNRGWTYYNNLGKIKEMIADSRLALELFPDNDHARFNLALGLLIHGEAEEADKEYKQAVKTDNVKLLEEILNEIEEAVVKYGPLEGADQVQELIRNRLSELNS